MTDEHGVAPAAESLVQGAGVESQGPGVVAAVLGDRGRGVPPEERGHGVEAGVGQTGQEMAPGVGGVGEAVEAQGQWTVVRARLEIGELGAVGPDGVVVHVREGSSDPVRAAGGAAAEPQPRPTGHHRATAGAARSTTKPPSWTAAPDRHGNGDMGADVMSD